MRRVIAGESSVSKPRKEPKPPVFRLATGMLDDNRKPLLPSDREYAVFADAYRRQDDWGDDEHSRFWRHHLSLWEGKRGNRSNTEALAWVVFVARWRDGLDDDRELAAALQRDYNDLRDRGVFKLASDIEAWERGEITVDGRPRPDDPTLGPAHPLVVQQHRLERLPRVWVDNDSGANEYRPPPPGCGDLDWRSVIVGSGHDAWGSLGEASIDALNRGLAALANVRRARGPVGPSLQEMVDQLRGADAA